MSRDGIFPPFRPNASDRSWISNELEAAKVASTLWTAAPNRVRRDSDFLAIIIRCGWLNDPKGNRESTRVWRNRSIAGWLGLDESADIATIAQRLGGRLRLTPLQSQRLLNTPSGITHYYSAARPATLRAITRNADALYRACDTVSRVRSDTARKVGEVATILLEIPTLRIPGGKMSPLNGLTPAVACLDPQRRFPIMNSRTAKLLAALGKSNDADGAMTLSRLIGQYGIRHSFALDVYAASGTRRFPSTGRARVPSQRDVGWRDETTGAAILQERKIRIRRLHNQLTNRLIRALEWRHQLAESEFDILIDPWRKNRRLLIEAKTGTSGPAGRMQLRQAIGQLFDYRWRTFSDRDCVDLALLTPTKPGTEVIRLLESLDIDALWFEGNVLKGTIQL